VRTFLLICIAASLSGCVVPQREEPAAAPLAADTLGLTGASTEIAQERWWTVFGDPQLDSIIDDALRDNPDLARALARLRSAQAQSIVANAGNDPSFGIDGDASWQRLSENYYIPPPWGGTRTWIGQATLSLAWTLDFWGKQAALIRQAESQIAANTLDIAAARLSLTGAIAQAYLDLNRAWELLDIATRLQTQREELLRLTQDRVRAGLDTQVEIKTAEANLAQARNAVLEATSMRDLAVHRVAALAGYGADRYARIERPCLQLDAALALPDTLPLDLLSRRPDVLAARARIEAATHGREAARADFYPDINLRAFVGMQAIGLDELVDSGSHVYGVGPAFHMPIFNSQRLRAQYKSATAALDETIASYNAVVLQAVRESADQITLNAALARQIAELQQAVAASSEAYEIARTRYGAGLTTQLTVLNAETQVLNARRDLVTANTNLALARIALRLMLGGSFDPRTAS
jgi:NodT family efflux transporter outer membrane factor (OMF) lipoprotein